MSETFKAGDGAPSSGVYKVVHAGRHAQPHYVTVLYGDKLPQCHECLGRTRFELAISAVYINAHPLFVLGHNE